MSNVNKLHPLQLREGYTFTRLLIEVALASNAPTTLKVKVLFNLISDVDGRLFDIRSASACSPPLLHLSSRT